MRHRTAIAAARDTADEPGGDRGVCPRHHRAGGPPAYPGMPGAGPDLALARRNAAAVGKAIGVLRELVPGAGSYVSEAGFVDPDWRHRSFGENYPRLLAVKRRYDPGMAVHHAPRRWQRGVESGRFYAALTALGVRPPVYGLHCGGQPVQDEPWLGVLLALFACMVIRY